MSTGQWRKYLTLISIIAASATALLAWSQPWFYLNLPTASETPHRQIEVAGSLAAPALAGLALAGLALVGALAISGPLFQVILGFLAIVIGGCIALSAALAVGDPLAASAPSLTAVTGVSSSGPLISLVESTASTIWPLLGFVAATMMVAAGLAVFVTRRTWPSMSQRHNRVRFEPVTDSRDNGAPHTTDDQTYDPIAAWDQLSSGSDPTK